MGWYFGSWLYAAHLPLLIYRCCLVTLAKGCAGARRHWVSMQDNRPPAKAPRPPRSGSGTSLPATGADRALREKLRAFNLKPLTSARSDEPGERRPSTANPALHQVVQGMTHLALTASASAQPLPAPKKRMSESDRRRRPHYALSTTAQCVRAEEPDDAPLMGLSQQHSDAPEALALRAPFPPSASLPPPRPPPRRAAPRSADPAGGAAPPHVPFPSSQSLQQPNAPRWEARSSATLSDVAENDGLHAAPFASSQSLQAGTRRSSLGATISALAVSAGVVAGPGARAPGGAVQVSTLLWTLCFSKSHRMGGA